MKGKYSSGEELLYREFVCVLVVCTAVVLVCGFLDAPFHSAPDNGTEVKAPWIFVGIQGLLARFPAGAAGLAFPAAILAFWASLPFWRRKPATNGEEQPAARLPEKLAFLGSVAALVLLTVWGYS